MPAMPGSTKRQKVVARVRDLRRLAEGTPSPEEASAARALADRLVEQYGLTEDEVSPPAPPPMPGPTPEPFTPSVADVAVLHRGEGLDVFLARVATGLGVQFVKHRYGLDLSKVVDQACGEMMRACKTPAEQAVAEKVRAAIKEWI